MFLQYATAVFGEELMTGRLAPQERPEAAAAAFIRLKLSQTDLEEVLRAALGRGDPQCAEIVALLRRPFREFYDFSDPRDVNRLRAICAEEGIRMPGPDEQ